MDEPMLQHGVFSWNELMTTDPEAAKSFYKNLFGWTTRDMPMEGMTYTIVSAAGKDIAGLMGIPAKAQGMPPAWGAYVTVDNVDLTAKTAKELGGKVLMEPTEIPDVGRFCVIQDPQGATISAITYKKTS